VIQFLHQRQQLPQLAGRETGTGEPVEILSGQVGCLMPALAESFRRAAQHIEADFCSFRVSAGTAIRLRKNSGKTA